MSDLLELVGWGSVSMRLILLIIYHSSVTAAHLMNINPACVFIYDDSTKRIFASLQLLVSLRLRNEKCDNESRYPMRINHVANSKFLSSFMNERENLIHSWTNKSCGARKVFWTWTLLEFSKFTPPVYSFSPVDSPRRPEIVCSFDVLWVPAKFAL